MPETSITASDALVSLWLPEEGELKPDPADADLLWWIAPGSGGGFSLALSSATATPLDGLLSMERELADRVDVERDETVKTTGGPMREVLYRTERRVERRAVRRRFWIDPGLSAGYIVPEGEQESQELYDRILDSVRVTNRD